MKTLNPGDVTFLEVVRTDRDIMIDYLKLKVREEDWHGVSDAANDLRELDAAAPTITPAETKSRGGPRSSGEPG